MKSPNVRWQETLVGPDERSRVLGQRAVVLWFTGLSGSGKSTIAREVERRLVERRAAAYVLDGDNIRHGLSGDLGFSPEDRHENIRRISEVARLFVDAGLIVLCAFVSPYRADRRALRESLPAGAYVEIHVQASLEACRARDPKGLYARSDAGEIDDLTGVSAPYEAPEDAELVLDTERDSLSDNVERVLGFLEENGYIGAGP